MNINRSDLNLFIVFEAIYSQGGVTLAASQLNLSQPAISHALARLREQLDDQLFVRRGQKLIPTTKADAMIDPVRSALKLLKNAAGNDVVFDPSKSTAHLKIGMRTLIENSYFLSLFSLIQETAPAIKLSSAPMDRRRMGAALASGELNAAIDIFHPPQDGVKRQIISSGKSVVIARRGHPFIDGSLDLQTYLAASHVCVTSRPLGQGPEDVALSRIGKTRNIMARCQQINTAMRILSMSNHILTTTETFARSANIWFDHQILPSPFETPSIEIFLYWHKNTQNDPTQIWLRNMIYASTKALT